jgi:DNA-binding transcriptional regulator GbsR (MarR family)
MNHTEAKKKFLETWGTLGTQWGINKTIAQIHALLLISPQPLSTDNIMDDLKISRGNANMSLRTLLDWQLIYKKAIPGDRKEYFIAEKDIWKWSHRIGKIRKQKELDPMLESLTELAAVKKGTTEADKEFEKQIKSLKEFTAMIDNLGDKLLNSNKGEMLIKIMKLVL